VLSSDSGAPLAARPLVMRAAPAGGRCVPRGQHLCGRAVRASTGHSCGRAVHRRPADTATQSPGSQRDGHNLPLCPKCG